MTACPRPPKRARKARRPLRRKAKRKAKLHDADRLFSQFIRTRDGWQCQRCGSPVRIQCAHIIGRAYRAIRFSPTNATALCQGCHVYFTHRALEWMDWVEARWPGRWSMLKAQALAAHEHPDYDEICSSLRFALGVRE